MSYAGRWRLQQPDLTPVRFLTPQFQRRAALILRILSGGKGRRVRMEIIVRVLLFFNQHKCHHGVRMLLSKAGDIKPCAPRGFTRNKRKMPHRPRGQIDFCHRRDGAANARRMPGVQCPFIPIAAEHSIHEMVERIAGRSIHPAMNPEQHTPRRRNICGQAETNQRDAIAPLRTLADSHHGGFTKTSGALGSLSYFTIGLRG